MLKTSANGTQASSSRFSLHTTAETLVDLSRPIDPRHLKTKKQGVATINKCPWNTIAKHLHHRPPSWCWEVQSVQEVGGAVVVTGRLTIFTADGELLHYSAVIDNRTVITGSFNWSPSAAHQNDEVLLVIHSPLMAAHFTETSIAL
jgi:hypothetical protein